MRPLDWSSVTLVTFPAGGLNARAILNEEGIAVAAFKFVCV